MTQARERDYGSEEEYFIDHPFSRPEAESYAARMLACGLRVSFLRRELGIRQVPWELADQIIDQTIDGLVCSLLAQGQDGVAVEKALAKRGIGPLTADEIIARCRGQQIAQHYVGWIAAGREERGFLEGLGIRLGRYDENGCEFQDCRVSAEALGKLDQHWGRFIWGLEPSASAPKS